MADISSYSVSFTCPNSGKRVTRSAPMVETRGTRYWEDGESIVFVISNCPCGEEHTIHICSKGES